MKRRTFLSTVAATAGAQMLPGGVTRTWIGPEYFANRYQDWRLHEGRIECLASAAGKEVRAVAWLTRSVEAGAASGKLRVRTGTLEDAGGGGFSGFLIGAGGGELDWRAAALVHHHSGANGGILCVWNSDGSLSFRDHTSEEKPTGFAELPGQRKGTLKPRAVGEDVELTLDITPQGAGRFKLTLEAGGASAVLEDVEEKRILGGIALVSSPAPGADGARYWFRDLASSGAKIAVHPERTFGPILGALYSVNGNVLKLTAQFAPLGESDPVSVRLDFQFPGTNWRTGPEAAIDPAGYVARFRIPDWDSTKDWRFRVVYGDASYDGHIPADPGESRPVRVAFFSCAGPVGRGLDSGPFRPTIPGEAASGRFTKENIYFPHSELIENAVHRQLDMVAFLGDQVYDNNPTKKDPSDRNPKLDYLYKWSLWMWAFRDLTRYVPAVVLADDHDVYQGNIWGQGGRQALNANPRSGGYVQRPEFVNMVMKTQCSHNPDPFDPAPAARGIAVYYTAFRYGGVEFAILEDRKFKSGPEDRTRVTQQLLGPRQESFLKTWGEKAQPGSPRIAFSETMFGCLYTDANGKAARDFDSNGWPKDRRDTAMRLLKGSVILSGDTHLAAVVRHGVDKDGDGPVQFTCPAGGANAPGWFEPAAALPNRRGPHTGDFVDAFGNRMRVLAVANPKVSQADYRKYKTGRGSGLGDRKLKREGYGLVVVDHKAKTYTLECWEWNTDPAAPGARQFDGWPIVIRFDEA